MLRCFAPSIINIEVHPTIINSSIRDNLMNGLVLIRTHQAGIETGRGLSWMLLLLVVWWSSLFVILNKLKFLIKIWLHLNLINYKTNCLFWVINIRASRKIRDQKTNSNFQYLRQLIFQFRSVLPDTIEFSKMP